MAAPPLISVVTPVYNDAAYLGECIESILAQTYENWDYTIVDNASTDATPDIAREYAERDPRVRLLRFDKFVDSTANHNRAFAAIHDESEFCKMVQADDWLYPECLARMVEAAAVSNTVGVVSSYQLSDTRLHLDGLPYTKTFAPGSEIIRMTLLGTNVTGPPTTTMLRSEFIRQRRPFFQRDFRHDDLEAILWLLSRHDFAFVHQVLSFSRVRPGARSSWSSKMNTHVPEHITFLLRYGRPVMKEAEFRARLRTWLTNYVWWHVRQVPRPSRFRDPGFFELHWHERQMILDAAEGDPEVVAAMAAVAAMLSRRELRLFRTHRVGG